MTTTGESMSNSIAFDMYNRFRACVRVEADVCAFFERRFLAERGWDAVVVNEEITPDEAADIATACRRFGYTKATALDIDHFDSGLFHEIGLDAASLSSLETTFFSPSYLVVEQKERFMLVSDSDYYWSIAGSHRFLEQCFRKSLAEVNQDFLDATRGYREGPSKVGRFLGRIAAEMVGRPAPTA